MNYPRKRPQSQSGGSYSNNNGGGSSNNNNQRRRSFSGGSSGGQSNNNSGGNRPRKNYGAMREKYLAQARDALAMGDRVLAENYFQHADHCFRMIAEENASRPQRVQNNPQQKAAEAGQENNEIAENTETSESNESQENAESAGNAASDSGDESINMNVSSLPAFLTASYTPPKVDGAQPVAPVQDWEE